MNRLISAARAAHSTTFYVVCGVAYFAAALVLAVRDVAPPFAAYALFAGAGFAAAAAISTYQDESKRKRIQERDDDSNLIAYAKSELQRAGMFDNDSDYGGMLGDAALDIVKVFSRQGHSGYSAAMTTAIVEKLMRFEPLTPLTYAEDEWNDVGDLSSTTLWQNKRKSTVFSEDHGLTYYDINEEDRPIHQGRAATA
jgi:hypothetical protein